MADLIVDYRFTGPTVSNPGGSLALTSSGTTVVAGVVDTFGSKVAATMAFAPGGRAEAALGTVAVNRERFCIQLTLMSPGPVRSRQTVVDCDLLPFSVFLDPGKSDGTFTLCVTVVTTAFGARSLSTQFTVQHVTRAWHEVTIAFDQDTLALTVNGIPWGLHAFPDGRLAGSSGGRLRFGAALGPKAQQFLGSIAMFRWYNDIPADIEARLDEQRSQAEWFISYKRAETWVEAAVGALTGPIAFDETSGSYAEPHERGTIYYHDSVGAAFALSGPIHAAYLAGTARADLGAPVSDEMGTRQAGGRKCLFRRGGIYWSRPTGAVPVFGPIYAAYEEGGESAAFGFPIKPRLALVRGFEQEFERARIYYRPSMSMMGVPVQGPMLACFLAAGGVASLGHPEGQEEPILADGKQIGSLLRCESATIYQSQKTGAHWMTNALRTAYGSASGPAGVLGFPTSDVIPIPGRTGEGGMVTCERGSVLWFGGEDACVAYPFRVRIGRISTKESENFAAGQNDIYCRLRVVEDGKVRYNKRRPEDGDWSGNIKDVDFTIPETIVPNEPGKVVTFSVEVKDADPGADDSLGTYRKTLNAANGWGMRKNEGIFNSGAFSKIRSITAALVPQGGDTEFRELEKFWSVDNRPTGDITWAQYASAFRNVDSDSEWWDPTDHVQMLYFEAVVKNIAESGNCFGMSLEAIYARAARSLFALPISRFKDWSVLRNEFNIKHCYQAGADVIWSFLDNLKAGNWNSPKWVFERTREEFARGNPSVLCLVQTMIFTGAAHAVLPVAWDTSKLPWVMKICDPSRPGQLGELKVHPILNTFEYSGANDYAGGPVLGGHIYFFPYSMLARRPLTPFWDLLQMIWEGTMVLVGDAAETASLQDVNGNDLDAYGSAAAEKVRKGQSIDHCFATFRGTDALAPSMPTAASGELLVRAEAGRGKSQFTPSLLHRPVDLLLGDARLTSLAAAVKTKPALTRALAGRSVAHVLNDAATLAQLPTTAIAQLRAIAATGNARDFVHQLKSRKAGPLSYLVRHGLTQVHVSAATTAGEVHKVHSVALGTSKSSFRIESPVVKPFMIQITNRLGVGRDRIRIRIENVMAGPEGDLHLNLKPGLGGLDVVSGARQSAIPVTIDTRIGGKASQLRMDVPLNGGVRMKLGRILDGGGVGVSRIDRLFGAPLTRARGS
jgi:hypothetical protein